MARTPPEISSRIRAKLAQTAPGLSMEKGTPERGIIDACAEAISEAHIDQYLVGSLLDIDNKTGLELEQFAGIFGMGRLQGKAAEGVIRVTLDSPAPRDHEIPEGAQFYSKKIAAGKTGVDATKTYYVATQATIIPAGEFSADVPVKATTTGRTGDADPDTVTYLGAAIGSGEATNLSAITGGKDPETDAELRQRFKDTLLRNMAGTTDYYKALCRQNNHVSKVSVFGPAKLYHTQIRAPQSYKPLSADITQDVKYVWDGMHSCYVNLGQAPGVGEDPTRLGDDDDDDIIESDGEEIDKEQFEQFFSPVYDYQLQTGASPVFHRIESGDIETGQVIDLEFQYVSAASRNSPDPGNAEKNITNKVDIYIDGIKATTVTEKTVVSAAKLSANSDDMYWTGNFERVGTSGVPSEHNRFMRLGSVPVVSFPSIITKGDTVYVQGDHYHLLRDTTVHAGSYREISGIEWLDVIEDGPDVDTELTLNYTYNSVPETLAHVMSKAKQVCTDVMVHQAAFRYIRPCLTIEYDRSYAVQVVKSAVVDRLRKHFADLEFGAWIRVSAICLAVQQVRGVANVRLTEDDNSARPYGIEVYHDAEDVTQAVDSPHETDFKLEDGSLALLKEVTIVRDPNK